MGLARRIGNLFRRSRVEDEIRAEMEAHLALRMEDNIAAGMTPEEARRDARVRFGNPVVMRERSAGVDAALGLDGVWRDVRYALRQLQRAPGFALTAVITLALGIGANIVVFGVLNTVLLHPLDVSDSQNLYQLRHGQWMIGRLLTTSYPAFEDFRRRNSTFRDMAGVYGYSHANLQWRNMAISVHGDEVTGNYFDLLGARPEVGRLFHESDEHGLNSAPYVVLSDALWRSAFHAEPGVVGAVVEMNRHPFTVVGVVAAPFHGTERFVRPDYWIPIVNQEQGEESDFLHNRADITVTVIGRLKAGVTPQQATEDLNAIAAELAKEYPETDDGLPLRLIHPGLLGDEGDVIRGVLWSVTALALLVLLAACTNLASLFAARAADRSRELALRLALGSSRRRMMRQLLTEAMMLALMGGVVGLGTAGLLLSALNGWPSPVGVLEVSVDARVYLAGIVFTLGSALLFGMLPMRQVWQSSPLQVMKSGRADATFLRWFALRDLLLGAQIAICTLLVAASLVAVRGMVRTLHTPLGFEPRNAMLVEIDTSQLAETEEEMSRKQRAMLEALRNIPGVTAAGAVSRTPMTGGMRGVPIFQPGTTDFKLENSVLAPYVFSLSPGYLEAAGTRLLSGRDVAWQDTEKTPYVAIVNETFARKMWGKTQAIGQRFVLQSHLTEVVGVAEDGKYHDLQEAAQPVAYVPLSQSEDGDAVFVVRTQRAANEMAVAVARTLGGIAPNMPVTAQSWTDSLGDALFPERAATVALGVMGLLAAMLAVTGIFGMAAYSVSKRLKELGIRVALGAQRPQLFGAAVGRPLGLLAAGSILGIIGALLSTPLLSRAVDNANPRDPLVLGGVAVTMLLLGGLAICIPARRALGVNPSTLMREE